MYIASWSGGKDSTLACHRAIKAGYAVGRLVNFISDDHRRVRFHGTEASLIGLQAELAEIELYQKETDSKDYEGGFKEALRALKEKGAEGMVFGDIDIEEHRQWVERVCGQMGMEAVEPLWGEERETLVSEFIGLGFEAVIVCCQGGLIDKEWVGRKMDGEFIEYLRGSPGVDLCGERGEYHTFVTAGPLFKGRIEITGSSVVGKEGYWFLDIKEYEVVKPPLAA